MPKRKRKKPNRTAREEIDANDAKEEEEEAEQDRHVGELWQAGEQRGYDLLERRDAVDCTQSTQHAHRTDRREISSVFHEVWQPGSSHNDHIEEVPSFAQVGLEAQGNH